MPGRASFWQATARHVNPSTVARRPGANFPAADTVPAKAVTELGAQAFARQLASVAGSGVRWGVGLRRSAG